MKRKDYLSRSKAERKQIAIYWMLQQYLQYNHFEPDTLTINEFKNKYRKSLTKEFVYYYLKG